MSGKNILFYYDNYSGEGARGGTEVATARIARALQASGQCRAYHAYRSGKGTTPETLYTDAVRLPKHGKGFETRLADFIRVNHIDVVVNMSRFFRHPKLRKAISLSGRDARLLFMHHFAPGSETAKTTWSAAWHLLRLDPLNPLYWLRATFYPLLKLPRRLRYPGAYREVYETSDRVILLSEGYVGGFQQYGRFKDKEKFVAIPNIYDTTTELQLDGKKEKRVLILSRMDEIQKRITLALQVWKKIEERPELADWRLDIVGSGHDMRGLKKLASRLRLQRADFHGWQNSKPFLEKASILMMTSLYEGLSLSMIEAAMFGAVPVAFNSYASLRDIVEDGVTGVAVEPFGDTDAFATRLAELMLDENRRSEMVGEGRRRASRYSSVSVASRWLDSLRS